MWDYLSGMHDQCDVAVVPGGEPSECSNHGILPPVTVHRAGRLVSHAQHELHIVHYHMRHIVHIECVLHHLHHILDRLLPVEGQKVDWKLLKLIGVSGYSGNIVLLVPLQT